MNDFEKINLLLATSGKTTNKEVAHVLATQKYLAIFGSVVAAFYFDKAISAEDLSQDFLLEILKKGLSPSLRFSSDLKLKAFIRKSAFNRSRNAFV